MTTSFLRLLSWTGGAMAVMAALLGCGGDEDVGGHWCGAEVDSDEQCLGDEVHFLELSQSGDEVTGVWCEEYRRECYPIENGQMDGDSFTARYSFSSGYVEASLTLDGDILEGTIFASKCSCDLPTTLHRIQ